MITLYFLFEHANINIYIEFRSDIYKSKLLLCILPPGVKVKEIKNVKKFEGYDMRKTTEREVCINTIMHCLMGTDQCYQFCIDGNDYKIFGLCNTKTGYFKSNWSLFQMNLLHYFLSYKLLKQINYFNMVLKKLEFNLKCIDKIDSFKGRNMAFNIADIVIILCHDSSLILRLNSLNLLTKIIVYLGKVILKFGHHESTSYFIDLMIYLLLYTSKSQRRIIRNKLKVTSIKTKIFKSGICTLYVYILLICTFVHIYIINLYIVHKYNKKGIGKCHKNVWECNKICILIASSVMKYESYKVKRLNITSQRLLLNKHTKIKINDFPFKSQLHLLKCSFILCEKKNIEKLYKCKGCNVNHYCTRKHQKQDWKFIHSTMCHK